MRAYRERLRREGLRPVQIWVPDQRAEDFAEILRSQVERLDAGDESAAMLFVEEAADWGDE